MAARTCWGALLLLLAVVLSVSVALAEDGPPSRLEQLSPADRERARGLMDEGDAKMERGDSEGALASYLAADAIVGVPTTGIEVGRAQAALGLWVEARDTWVRVSHYPRRAGEPRPFTVARREAERLALQMAERIPTVAIEVAEPLPAGVDVRLDGRRLSAALLGVPLRVNPGHHRVEAQAPGHAPAAAEIELVERMAKTVRFSLKPTPLGPRRLPRAQDELPSYAGHQRGMWSGFAVASAGAAVGTATGIGAVDETRAVAQRRADDVCPPAVAGNLERARLASTISTVTFVLGGVRLGVGLWQAVVGRCSLGRSRWAASEHERPCSALWRRELVVSSHLGDLDRAPLVPALGCPFSSGPGCSRERIMSAGQPRTPFDLMGGDEDLVVRLVQSFYAHMAEAEPELARVHELDASGQISERTRERFTRFLIEWLGGPANYSPREGHPRLRMRHAHVPIDSALRDAWIRSMTFALDEQGITGDVRTFLDARFLDLATFLRNRPDA